MKKKLSIPMLPMPIDKAIKVASPFQSIGNSMGKFFPGLDFELTQSQIDYEPREWISIALFAFSFYFLMFFFLMFTVQNLGHVLLVRNLMLSLSAGATMGVMAFIFIILYPKMQVNKKIRDIERNLPYALQHLLIEIRSGVPLYNSLNSIAQSNYGTLSTEIHRAINEINTGKSETAALEAVARMNPSFYLRRIMWQIVNALKSGADIGDTMEQIVSALATDQVIAIKKYGAQLNPLALMYMIFAVIFPTLGITFLLVISSFLGLGFDIQMVLIGILGFLLVFQIMMIGLIKTRRPIVI